MAEPSKASLADFSQQDGQRRKPIYDPPTPQYTYLNAPTDLEKWIADRRIDVSRYLSSFMQHTVDYQAFVQSHLDHARVKIKSVQDPSEKWMPEALYMGIAFLATKRVLKRRTFLVRWPVSLGALAGTAYYTMPQTTTNLWQRKIQPLIEEQQLVDTSKLSFLKQK